MKVIKLSVQDFALPAPRRGSIEPSSGHRTTLGEGQEFHRRWQEERSRELPEFEAEKAITASFERGEYRFEISGRMDGFVPGERPLIEEVKSSFNIFELSRAIKEKRYDHPYFIQLVTYGYFHWLKTGERPDLVFHLFSSRRNDTLSFDVFWAIKEYESWLDRRLDELVHLARSGEKRTARRIKTASALSFPFPRPRSGQMELISFVEKGFGEKKRMLLQAPTGLGKTVGVLYPSLKDALGRGQRVLYLTPKNSQQSVAEEAMEKFSAQGCKTKSLTVTAKAKMCLKAEPICNPDYCEYARDYYDKVRTHDLREVLGTKRRLTSKVIQNLGKKFEVCPFELQLEAISEADVIICDYNYVFGNQTILGSLSHVGFEQEGKPNLVIDEAHNLPSRTMGGFSSELSSSVLEGLRSNLEALPKKFRRSGLELLDQCLETLKAATPAREGKVSAQPDLESFLLMQEELKGYLTSYLDSEVEIKPRDPVLRLVFYWSEFTEILAALRPEQKEFFMTAQNDGKARVLKITCCDASLLIKDRYDFFQNVVAFSATLKPFQYYAKLSGLAGDDLLEAEFQSPFKPENRKVLIIPQVSTKYSTREQNYPKVADAISRIISLRSGNYLAFFPSFDFMERVLKNFTAPLEFEVMKQSRFMKNEDVELTLEALRSLDRPRILFAVQGGVFSEGIDYLGDMAIGAFVVGPPLPNFDFERERMKDYYQENYQAGFDYAYTFPAMAKAVQAAGRVIRSEEDRGLIVLMDDRFLEKNYGQSLPHEWFEASPGELVSRKILGDIEEFWKGQPNSST
jgi:DNA excision repair protein ERCC-2